MIPPLIKKHTKKINMFIRMIDTNREIDQILVSEYNIDTKKLQRHLIYSHQRFELANFHFFAPIMCDLVAKTFGN
jgi:carbonic anhydrase